MLQLCPLGGPVADVGSGHGRLALELKRREPKTLVYATEGGEGPARELRRLLPQRCGVEVLEGLGLAPLRALCCRGAVIAGLGGRAMAALLDRDLEVARRLEWLCLQPAQQPEALDAWLGTRGWTALERRSAREGRRIYRLCLMRPS